MEDYGTIYTDAENYAGSEYSLNAYLEAMEAKGLPAAVADEIFAMYFPQEKKDKGTTEDVIN